MKRGWLGKQLQQATDAVAQYPEWMRIPLSPPSADAILVAQHKGSIMGVDARVTLPANVRLSNVANVMGAVAGCPATKSFFDRDPKNGWSTRVEGVEVLTTSIPSMCEIRITPPNGCVDGEKSHFTFYHFEPDNGVGRLMLPRSTAFWIAVMHRVVDFFGGEIDYNDCDDVSCDYSVPHKTWEENSPSDGEAWYTFQNRILEIKPITVEEWNSFNLEAAYKIGE